MVNPLRTSVRLCKRRSNQGVRRPPLRLEYLGVVEATNVLQHDARFDSDNDCNRVYEALVGIGSELGSQWFEGLLDVFESSRRTGRHSGFDLVAVDREANHLSKEVFVVDRQVVKGINQAVHTGGHSIIGGATVDIALDIGPHPLEQRLGHQLIGAREVAIRRPA